MEPQVIVNIVLMVALLILGIFLVVAVLLQHGKSYGLSGTISGGAETFFGKDKGGRLDKILARATTVVGIIFVVLALTVFLYNSMSGGYDKYLTRFENNLGVGSGFGSILDSLPKN